VIRFRATSSDVQDLEHFEGGKAMVVRQSGGQTFLDFDYGKPVPFPRLSAWPAYGAPGTMTKKATAIARLSLATKRLRWARRPFRGGKKRRRLCRRRRRRPWRLRNLHRWLRRPRRCIRRCLRPRCLCRCRCLPR
jgi:hypothetical protein